MKPSRNEPEAIRKFRHLWIRRRPWGDDWQRNAKKTRRLIAEIRMARNKKKDPKRVAAGKLAQAKGKRSQSAYIKRWRGYGYTVLDKSALEAAGVETGVDLEVREAELSIQNKERREGDHLLIGEARKAWDALETLAFLRGHMPVLRWCESRGGHGQSPCDLSVVRTDFLEELVVKARPPTS